MMREKSVSQLILCIAIIALLFMLYVQAATANVYLGGDNITVRLGETQQHHLTLYNPIDRRETFDIQISTDMNEGELAATVAHDVGGTQGQVDVAPGENRTVPITYTGSQCSLHVCEGTVTVLARSVIDRHTYSDTINVNIERPAPMRGAPGITELQLLVVTILASFIFYTGKRYGRRNQAK